MMPWQHGAPLTIICSLLVRPHSGSLPRGIQQQVARVNAQGRAVSVAIREVSN